MPSSESQPPFRAFFLAALLLFLPIAEAKVFRIGLITPPSHIWTQAAYQLSEDLDRESNGRHSMAVFPSRQLGNEAQMLQLMQTGALDMAMLTAAEVSNRVPEFGALYTPYLAKNISEAAALLRNEEANNLLALLPDEIGVIGLGYGMAGMRQILSTRPLATLDDIRGKKIRITPFEPVRDFYRLARAAPTPMPLAAVYEALANGQIDMLDIDLELIIKLKYHELADTLLLSNHMMFPMVAMISGKVWIRMNNEDRALLTRLMSQQLDGVLEKAIAGEAAWEEDARALEINLLDVGPEFFGDTLNNWESIWVTKSGAVEGLRHAMMDIRNDNQD